MPPPIDPTLAADLTAAVRAAALRDDVRAAVDAVYAEVTTAVDARRPRCDVSGRCCRFEEYGHRLYVTTAELAHFLHAFEHAPRSPQLDAAVRAWDGPGCPFQLAKLCGVHTMRPFGCRMFFCDPTSTQWQNDAYETFHARLKRVHEDLDVPYFYVEWRAALGALLERTGPIE